MTYDLDGNMLTANGMSLTYDSANRLLSANGNSYTYDVENTRVKNLCNGVETQYSYNTNAELSQLLVKTTGSTVTKYVYGNGLIGEESNNTFKTYHFDYRGSTVAITDISGTVTDTFSYDSYGNLTNRTGTTDAIFLYNGEYGVVTDTNGLLYMRARYYSPELRRFVNADILMGDINNSTTLNRYAYANGNPISNIDPFGLAADEGRGGNSTNNSKESDLLGVVWDFIKNAVEIEIGIGFGIAGQIDYSGIGIDVNAIVDMPNITISDRGYEEYIKSDISLTVDLFVYEIGPHYTEYDGEKDAEFTWFKEKDTITILSIGAYPIAGGSFSINIDHNYIIDRLVNLFEKK